MTPAQLAEIEARALAATEGPWVWRGTTKGWYLCCVKGLCSYVIDCFMNKLRVRDFKRDLMVEFNPFHPDAIFIAHARTDIPALIAEVKRLRALTKEVINEAEHGWSYASEYFRGKYEVEKTIAGLRAALDI